MADKKKESKVVLEREYNIPLRRKFLNASKYRRSKKAMITIKEFISKHMKADIIRVGRYLNLHVWKHGIKNPPHHVAVVAKKHDDGAVDVEFKGAPAKKEEKKSEAKPAAKPAEKKPEVKAETKPVEAKPAEKKPEVKVETKPVEAKPAEKKPEIKAEAKPAAKKE